MYIDWASINNQVYVVYTFWANLSFFREIGWVPPISSSQPAWHHLCPIPQLHQAQKFVLRSQPLSKTHFSYFAGGSFWIWGLKPLPGVFNTFVETISFWNHCSFLFLSEITRKNIHCFEKLWKKLFWEVPNPSPISELLGSGSKIRMTIFFLR
jgi:hypothetical protein